jgi:adenylyl- and sulfurtransferase ThiI
MQIEINRRDFEKQIKNLTDNLQTLGKKSKVEKAVYNALVKTAKKLHTLLKKKTPFGTGELYKSFKIEKQNNTSLQAGLNSVYAMYQEMGRRADGTHIIRRRPAGGETNYFKNTIDENSKELFKTFEEELANELLKNGLLSR